MQAKKCISSHLSTLADFAIEMFDVLDEINYQSYNDFVLRVGTWLRAAAPHPPPVSGPQEGGPENAGTLPLSAGPWDRGPKGAPSSSRNTSESTRGWRKMPPRGGSRIQASSVQKSI